MRFSSITWPAEALLRSSSIADAVTVIDLLELRRLEPRVDGQAIADAHLDRPRAPTFLKPCSSIVTVYVPGRR